MTRLLCFLLVIAGVCVGSGPLYTIGDPCYPAQCTASVLNDKGEIAGEFFDSGNGVDGRGFEVTSAGLITPLNAAGDSGTYVLPHWMNSSGALALEYGSFKGPSIAGIYQPQSRTLINLNSIFGWKGVSRALTINDAGEIAAIATDAGGSNSITLTPEFPSGLLMGITNNRVIIEVSQLSAGPSTQYWVVTAPSTGTVFLSKQVVSFSSLGHILEAETGRFGIPGYYIYVPGSGERQLAVYKEQPFAINNADQLLLRADGEDYYWDQSSPRRRLQDLVDPQSGWVMVKGIALNNSGQILVNARNGARTTSLLLSPPALRGAVSSAGITLAIP